MTEIQTTEFVSRQNIERYERLLKTELSELERQYVTERLKEERDFLASIGDASLGNNGHATAAIFFGARPQFVKCASIAFIGLELVGPALGI
jgi:hypothetical protein